MEREMRLHFFASRRFSCLILEIGLWQWQKRRGENQKLVLVSYCIFLTFLLCGHSCDDHNDYKDSE